MDASLQARAEEVLATLGDLVARDALGNSQIEGMLPGLAEVFPHISSQMALMDLRCRAFQERLTALEAENAKKNRERAPVFDEATIPQDVWSSLSPTARMALSSVFITFRRHLGDLSSSLASDLLANFKSFLLGSDLLFAPLDADPEENNIRALDFLFEGLCEHARNGTSPVRAGDLATSLFMWLLSRKSLPLILLHVEDFLSLERGAVSVSPKVLSTLVPSLSQATSSLTSLGEASLITKFTADVGQAKGVSTAFLDDWLFVLGEKGLFRFGSGFRGTRMGNVELHSTQFKLEGNSCIVSCSAGILHRDSDGHMTLLDPTNLSVIKSVPPFELPGGIVSQSSCSQLTSDEKLIYMVEAAPTVAPQGYSGEYWTVYVFDPAKDFACIRSIPLSAMPQNISPEYLHKCTRKWTSSNFHPQLSYHCVTCANNSSWCCCAACARTCHMAPGCRLVADGYMSSYCDCCDSSGCCIAADVEEDRFSQGNLFATGALGECGVPVSVKDALFLEVELLDLDMAQGVSLLVKSTGHIMSCGTSRDGALLHGTGSKDAKFPKPQVISSLERKKFMSVSASPDGLYALAISETGTVFAWGADIPSRGSSNASLTPHVVFSLGDVCITQVSAMGSFSLALDGFGNLFVAGSNTNNQLGLAAEFKELSSISDFLPCAALQGERVIQISRDIVLTDSGKVYCFGRLRTPMLNFTSTLGGPDGPFELDVQEHRIVDVSAAKNHVLLRNDMNQLLVGGASKLHHQLGLDEDVSNIFVHPSFPSLVTKVLACGNVSLVCTDSGDWFGCGKLPSSDCQSFFGLKAAGADDFQHLPGLRVDALREGQKSIAFLQYNRSQVFPSDALSRVSFYTEGSILSALIPVDCAPNDGPLPLCFGFSLMNGFHSPTQVEPVRYDFNEASVCYSVKHGVAMVLSPHASDVWMSGISPTVCAPGISEARKAVSHVGSWMASPLPQCSTLSSLLTLKDLDLFGALRRMYTGSYQRSFDQEVELDGSEVAALLLSIVSSNLDSLRTVVDEHEESASSYSFFLPFALELSEASGRILVDRLRASWLSIKADPESTSATHCALFSISLQALALLLKEMSKASRANAPRFTEAIKGVDELPELLMDILCFDNPALQSSLVWRSIGSLSELLTIGFKILFPSFEDRTAFILRSIAEPERYPLFHDVVLSVSLNFLSASGESPGEALFGLGGSSSGTSQFMDDMAPKVLQSFAQDLEALESSPASALSLASRSRKLEEFLCFVLKDMMMRFNKCSSEVKAHRVEDLYGTFMFHVGVDGNMLIVDMRPETLKPWGYSPGQKVLVARSGKNAVVVGVAGSQLFIRLTDSNVVEPVTSAKDLLSPSDLTKLSASVRVPGAKLNSNGMLLFTTRSAAEQEFDIRPESTSPFGFLHGQKVQTPNGPAIVVGLAKGSIWFHVIGESGASYWSTCKTAEDFQKKGFSVLEDIPLPQEETMDGGGASSSSSGNPASLDAEVSDSAAATTAQRPSDSVDSTFEECLNFFSRVLDISASMIKSLTTSASTAFGGIDPENVEDVSTLQRNIEIVCTESPLLNNVLFSLPLLLENSRESLSLKDFRRVLLPLYSIHMSLKELLEILQSFKGLSSLSWKELNQAHSQVTSIVETPHPYPMCFTKTWRIHVPGAKFLEIRFDANSKSVDANDFLAAFSDDARTKPVLSLLWGERFPKYVMVPGDTLLLDFHAASVDEEESKRWGFRASITGHRLPVRALQVFHAYRDITAFCGRIAVEMMSGEELAHDFLDSNLRLDIFSGGLEHHMFGSRGVDSDHPLIDFRTPELRPLPVPAEPASSSISSSELEFLDDIIRIQCTTPSKESGPTEEIGAVLLVDTIRQLTEDTTEKDLQESLARCQGHQLSPELTQKLDSLRIIAFAALLKLHDGGLDAAMSYAERLLNRAGASCEASSSSDLPSVEEIPEMNRLWILASSLRSWAVTDAFSRLNSKNAPPPEEGVDAAAQFSKTLELVINGFVCKALFSMAFRAPRAGFTRLMDEVEEYLVSPVSPLPPNPFLPPTPADFGAGSGNHNPFAEGSSNSSGSEFVDSPAAVGGVDEVGNTNVWKLWQHRRQTTVENALESTSWREIIARHHEAEALSASFVRFLRSSINMLESASVPVDKSLDFVTLLSEPVFQALCQGVRARRQNAFHRIEGMMLLSALLRNCAKDVDCVHSLLWTYASSIYNPTPAPELKQREGLLGGDETWAFLNWPPFSHHFLDGLWGCGRLLTEATEREQEQLFTQIIGIIKDQPQESSKELSVHTGCAILFLRILSMNFRLRDHNMLNKLRVFPLVRKLMSRRSQILETQLGESSTSSSEQFVVEGYSSEPAKVLEEFDIKVDYFPEHVAHLVDYNPNTFWDPQVANHNHYIGLTRKSSRGVVPEFFREVSLLVDHLRDGQSTPNSVTMTYGVSADKMTNVETWRSPVPNFSGWIKLRVEHPEEFQHVQLGIMCPNSVPHIRQLRLFKHETLDPHQSAKVARQLVQAFALHAFNFLAQQSLGGQRGGVLADTGEGFGDIQRAMIGFVFDEEEEASASSSGATDSTGPLLRMSKVQQVLFGMVLREVDEHVTTVRVKKEEERKERLRLAQEAAEEEERLRTGVASSSGGASDAPPPVEAEPEIPEETPEQIQVRKVSEVHTACPDMLSEEIRASLLANSDWQVDLAISRIKCLHEAYSSASDIPMSIEEVLMMVATLLSRMAESAEDPQDERFRDAVAHALECGAASGFLMGMGFDRVVCLAALLLSNRVVEAATNMVLEGSSEMVQLADKLQLDFAEAEHRVRSVDFLYLPQPMAKGASPLVEELEQLGYCKQMAIFALEECNMDLDAARPFLESDGLKGPIEEQQFQVALQVRNFARDVGGVQCAFNLCLVAARMHNNNADAAVSMILEDAESAQVQLEAEKARIEGELEEQRNALPFVDGGVEYPNICALEAQKFQEKIKYEHVPPEIAVLSDESHFFELLSLVCTVAASRAGSYFLAKPMRLKSILGALLYSSSDRCRRTAIYTLRRVLPQVSVESSRLAVKFLRSEHGDQVEPEDSALVDLLMTCLCRVVEVEVRDFRSESRENRMAQLQDWGLVEDISFSAAVGQEIINTLQVAHTLGAGADSSSTPWIGSHIRRVLEEAISLAGTAASMGNSTQSDHTLLLAVAATCVLCRNREKGAPASQEEFSSMGAILDIREGSVRIRFGDSLVLQIDHQKLKAKAEIRKPVEEGERLCRFCMLPLSPSNTVENPPSAALMNVCTDEYCVEKMKNSCLKLHPCGHPCGGIRGEESCLPCLRCNEGGLSQDADDYCNICWTEPLGCAPCIRLKCGHIFHHSSIMSMLGMKWGDYRIHFNFMDCPLCKAEMDHPSLDSILSPMRALKLAVREKALMRLEHENLKEAPEITTEGSDFYQDPAAFAMHRYNYFLCSRCKNPYFGGERQCGDAPPMHFDPSELICGGCIAGSGFDCPKHGRDYLEYKCRFCCAVACWFCFGTTHFCDPCHSNRADLKAANEWKCCNGPRDCPLRIQHPPPGQEFPLGCALCRNTF